jgi:intracellular sulfur oxidation DsrE/DsrF family protein
VAEYQGGRGCDTIPIVERRRENAMPMMLRTLFAALLLLPLAFSGAQAAEHKLALQISDNDPGKMNAVLNVAANVSKYYSEKGDEVEIQIVAFNAGLAMLRADKSPVLTRLKSFKQGMPNVTFMACQNTLDSMARNEGKEPPLVENATRVTAGVVTLIELGEKGWTIVRP